MKAASWVFKKNLEEHAKRLNLHETTLRNIEVQLGQLAHDLHKGLQGTLSSDMEVNPKGKEQYKAVTLRSEKQVGTSGNENQYVVIDFEEEAMNEYGKLKHHQEEEVLPLTGDDELSQENKVKKCLHSPWNFEDFKPPFYQFHG